MGLPKLKLPKSDNVWSDGEWVTNGYWLVKNDSVSVSDKTVDPFLRQNVRFARDVVTRELDMGENITLPAFEAILKVPSSLSKMELTQWRFRKPISNILLAAMRCDEYASPIKEHHLPLFDLAGLDYVGQEGDPKKPFYFMDKDKKVLGVLTAIPVEKWSDVWVWLDSACKARCLKDTL